MASSKSSLEYDRWTRNKQDTTAYNQIEVINNNNYSHTDKMHNDQQKSADTI